VVGAAEIPPPVGGRSTGKSGGLIRPVGGTPFQRAKPSAWIRSSGFLPRANVNVSRTPLRDHRGSVRAGSTGRSTRSLRGKGHPPLSDRHAGFLTAVAATSSVNCALPPVIPDVSVLGHESPEVTVMQSHASRPTAAVGVVGEFSGKRPLTRRPAPGDPTAPLRIHPTHLSRTTWSLPPRAACTACRPPWRQRPRQRTTTSLPSSRCRRKVCDKPGNAAVTWLDAVFGDSATLGCRARRENP
jgi:hypothetical protein